MNDQRPAASDNETARAKQPALQFRLRTLMVITAVLAALFATLKWLGLPPTAGFIILAVIAVSVVAAVGLLVVIAESVTDKDDGNKSD